MLHFNVYFQLYTYLYIYTYKYTYTYIHLHIQIYACNNLNDQNDNNNGNERKWSYCLKEILLAVCKVYIICMGIQRVPNSNYFNPLLLNPTFCAVVLWLSQLHLIQQNLGFGQVEVRLAVCRKFEMVRIFDNGLGWK